MKTPVRLIALFAIAVCIFSFAFMPNDEIVGSYKGMLQGSLQWSKINAGTQDQSMNSDEPKLETVKKNEKGEYYIENSKGVAIRLENLIPVERGITFTIPKQTVRGKGADSVVESELSGLNEFTLDGQKCDGYFYRGNSTISLSFGGTIKVKADTVVYKVPFTTSCIGFHKLKEESK